jgi:protein-S-isoprenylcysteine O-methyltransferase Ste14
MTRNWLYCLRAIRGYDLAIRAFGSAWFLFLAVTLGLKTLTRFSDINIADSAPTRWSELLAGVCMMLFYVALWWFLLTRPLPALRSDGVLPSLTAFAGSYLPWAVVLFAPAGPAVARDLASAALLVTGTILMVLVVLQLGDSFSIVPQARRLVRTGPYAIVRNPMYLAEEVAVLGSVLHFLSTGTLVLFIAHCVLQIGRIFYEEDLLRRSFPDYDDYARSTSRVIPYIW